MLKRLRVLGAALPLCMASQAARAQATGSAVEARPQIVTSAESEVRVAPDRATIMIGVQTRASSAAEAGRDNARRQRAVVDTLQALGVPANQISTLGYNVYPETRFDTVRQQQRVIGYVVSNVVRVELHNVAQVGPAIDAALAKGANQINSLQFSASNADDARHTALAQAVAKAHADAEAMARAAGGNVGDLMELSEAGGYAPPIYQPMMEARAGVMAAPTPIQPGELTVRISVSARWLFVAERR